MLQSRPSLLLAGEGDVLGPPLEMINLFKLITSPVRLALTLIKLPLTVMGCIGKLGCLLVVAAVIGVVVVVVVFLL